MKIGIKILIIVKTLKAKIIESWFFFQKLSRKWFLYRTLYKEKNLKYKNKIVFFFNLMRLILMLNFNTDELTKWVF